MIDRLQARGIAERHVDAVQHSLQIPLLILDSETIERDFGWVFYYDVDQLKSKEVIAGNGPLIVDRQTGRLYACGTSHPETWYIDKYERTGSVDDLSE